MTEHVLEDNRYTATLSDDRTYRYRLTRTWDTTLPTCVFIMLNPSTADETKNDPTIRRCIKYAETWGYGKLVVGNLFAYRTSDPDELTTIEDPVGPENDRYLKEICTPDRLVVVAWGNNGTLDDRCYDVMDKLYGWLGERPFAIGTTKHGHPWHPLRKPSDVIPRPFSYDGGESV